MSAAALTACIPQDLPRGLPVTTTPDSPVTSSSPGATIATQTSSPTAASPTSTRPPTTTTKAPTPPPAAPAGRRWVPAPGTTWQWQLTTPVDTSVDAQVFDIDGVENGPEVVQALHAKGRKVICYVNIGAAETFRPDYGAFPASVLGGSNGWPGEKWLDIRRLDILRPIMAARFDVCKRSGFDAIEGDLADGYADRTGFPLTAADQLAYNRMLAGLAHDRGLSIGLKNDLDQVTQLLGDFDFAINEQCMEYDECEALTPFIKAGKAVFHVEYDIDNATFCPHTTALGFSSMRKHLNLDAWRATCR
jgi:hypothetical protein